jgi:hypothetical protein
MFYLFPWASQYVTMRGDDTEGIKGKLDRQTGSNSLHVSLFHSRSFVLRINIPLLCSSTDVCKCNDV